MFVLINYANELFRKAQKLNTFTARVFGGFDEVIEYSDKDIDAAYYDVHKDILSNPRGNGLWLWKPYFILKTLENLEDGDILFYCDSASFFIGNAKKKVTQAMKNNNSDIWVSVIPLFEKQFTSRSVLALLECDEDEYKETNQYQAGFLAFKKNEDTLAFVKEWLILCEREELISPPKSDNDEPCFLGHREDQSILSILCKKRGIVSECDPTQYSVVPEKYKNRTGIILKQIDKSKKTRPFIILHRTPNNDLKICIKEFACAVLPRRISLRFIQIIE